jgi:hypothetical protein
VNSEQLTGVIGVLAAASGSFQAGAGCELVHGLADGIHAQLQGSRHACCRTQPVWGTCAGMIFLAERAEGERLAGKLAVARISLQVAGLMGLPQISHSCRQERMSAADQRASWGLNAAVALGFVFRPAGRCGAPALA